MLRYFKIYNSVFFVFVILGLGAQNKFKTIIKGNVMDSIGRPVINASIFADDITTKIKTDSKGEFKLKLKSKPTKLTFLSSSYGLKEVSYKGEKEIQVIYVRDSLNIKLALNSPIKKRARRYKKDEVSIVFNTIYDYLRARVSGVQVRGDNKVIVRGIGTFNSSTDPLFIVNGAPVINIIDINPNQIESVTVLKDSKAADYGFRGANGVIIITLIK